MMVFLHRGGPTGDMGISAGDLEIGQVVHLNESGVPIDYLVVHQGIPSNLYDASCEGTWLLRKDIREMGPFNSGGGNALPGSSILSTMSGYMKDYDLPVQAAIKTVKVPYCVLNGSATVNSGENGLQCRVFPISGYEIGLNNSLSSYLPIDGAKLSYFIDGDGADARSKRIEKFNMTNGLYWTRSPSNANNVGNWYISVDGSYGNGYSYNSYGIRPALILPYDFKFLKSEVS